MLNNSEKNNPFRVPENYFQNFNDEIMNMLPEKKEQKKIVPLWKSVSKWAAVAAVVTGVAILGSTYMDNHSPNINNIFKENYVTSDDNLSSLENDYYSFLEDDATRLVYKDVVYSSVEQ